MAEFTGVPTGAGCRFAVVASRFNEAIVTKLAEGAVDCLVRHGVAFEDVDVVWVPGAWELPAAVNHLLAADRYTAIVAVGSIIRGETPHFEFLSAEASRGLADLQREYATPVGFGLLTTDSMQQAIERAGGSRGNKGWDAAAAALEMVDLFSRLDAAGAESADAGEG